MDTKTQVADRNDQRLPIQNRFDLKIDVRRNSQSDENDKVQATPLDVSYNGIKLSTSQSLAFGESVVLHFSSSALELDFEIEADVRWIRQGEDQASWQVGCSFANHLTDDYVDAIANAGCVDRRQVPRCATQIEASVKLASKTDSFPVTLLDYSTSGIRFASQETIDPTEPLKLVLTDSEGELLQVGAISQWSMAYESGFLIGCEVVGQHRNLFEAWRQGLPGNKPRVSSGRSRVGIYCCVLIAALLVLFQYLVV